MMFQNRKIRVDAALYERLQTAAAQAGYATTDEFILHTLEQAAESIQESSDKQTTDEEILDKQIIDKQLRGLGYLE